MNDDWGNLFRIQHPKITFDPDTSSETNFSLGAFR